MTVCRLAPQERCPNTARLTSASDRYWPGAYVAMAPTIQQDADDTSTTLRLKVRLYPRRTSALLAQAPAIEPMSPKKKGIQISLATMPSQRDRARHCQSVAPFARRVLRDGQQPHLLPRQDYSLPRIVGGIRIR